MNENENWYDFETIFTSWKNELRKYLKMNGIRHRISTLNPGYHFDIFCTPTESDKIQKFLDDLEG